MTGEPHIGVLRITPADGDPREIPVTISTPRFDPIIDDLDGMPYSVGGTVRTDVRREVRFEAEVPVALVEEARRQLAELRDRFHREVLEQWRIPDDPFPNPLLSPEWAWPDRLETHAWVPGDCPHSSTSIDSYLAGVGVGTIEHRIATMDLDLVAPAPITRVYDRDWNEIR